MSAKRMCLTTTKHMAKIWPVKIFKPTHPLPSTYAAVRSKVMIMLCVGLLFVIAFVFVGVLFLVL